MRLSAFPLVYVLVVYMDFYNAFVCIFKNIETRVA